MIPTSLKIKSAPFPFLRLSAELRNRIYEEAFDGTIISDTATITPLDSGYGIILACKQTYAEALGLYYINHTFRFTGNWGYGTIGRSLLAIRNRCDHWLREMRPDNIQLMERIQLDLAPALRASLPVRKSAFPQWRERQHLDCVADVAASYIQGLVKDHKLRDGVVVASICSPLDGNYYTSTPMKTLEEHWEALRLGRHDLQDVRDT